jgi:chromosome partitioning protein
MTQGVQLTKGKQATKAKRITQTLAILNQKGGVGKTTLTVNLGGALAHLGKKVLIIDIDPQGNFTEAIGMQKLFYSERPTLYEALLGNKGVKLMDLVREHPHERFFFVPSNYQMSLADQALYMARNREHKLKGLVAQLEGQYDWILIDCPPAISNLTDNALNAARHLVIPFEPEPPAIRSLELLFDQVESLEKGLNIQIRVLAVVPNKVLDTTLTKRILGELRSAVPMVTPFEIRKRVLLQEAWSTGNSIFSYKSGSTAHAETQQEIMNLYIQLAQLVMERAERRGDEQ